MGTLKTDRGEGALAVSIVFTVLATFFVAVRIYTRAFMVKQIGLDDWTIIVSMIFSWAFFGLFAGEVFHGMGAPIATIPTDILRTQMICFWASIPIYQTSLITTKASILFQYKRIFATSIMRIACYTLIGVLAAYGTWTVISAWLNCIPVAKFWDDSIEGYCLNKEALWFSNSAMHIFTDILIMIYPMPVLRSLHLPLKQRIAVMGIFALGGFVCITSILRLKSLMVISRSDDPTYDNTGAATWSAVECNVAIICACLPSIRPLVSKLLPRFFSTGRSRNYQSRSKEPTGRSRTANFSTVQQSIAVVESDYNMHNLESRRGDSSDGKENLSDPVSLGGIKVTTIVSQRSVTHRDEEDNSSVRKLVD